MTQAPAPVATGKVVEVDHPLVRHKLTLLRSVNCDTAQFRALVEEIEVTVSGNIAGSPA